MKLSAPIFHLKRQAKLLSRETHEPLHATLDQVARREGYRSWSHLASSSRDLRPAPKLLAQLAPGDLALLGARPGHGKTLLGLELAVEAARAGVRSFFFSLEENKPAIADLLRGFAFEVDETEDTLVIDTADEICADYIVDRVGLRQRDSLVVIDYLQLLDQRRRNPELAVQVETLSNFARTAPSIIVALSQIDRSFDVKLKTLPDLLDVRLPNPADLTKFTKTCFLHNGELEVR